MFIKQFVISFLLYASSVLSIDFVLFTQPKTGTHLLRAILKELSGKGDYCPRNEIKDSASKRKMDEKFKIIEGKEGCPNEKIEQIWMINHSQETFIHFHTPYTVEMEKFLAEKNNVVFFVKRDPRDQIVSLLNHYKKFKFLNKEVEKIPSDGERLLYMIRHTMRRQLLLYRGWLTSPISCVLDFNHLMGAHGGEATDEDAIAELKKITTILDLDFSDDRLEEIYRKYFGRTDAFFKGKVGSWKDYFSEEHKSAVKEEIGDLLIELGFEKDLRW